jgi:precorrin-3B synthase
LRRALARISVAASLAAKISVAVDGGGALNLDGLAADVRLRAMRIDGDDALLLSVGGDGASAAELGAVALPHGVDAALRLLEFIARHGRGTRAKDIVAAEGIAAFRSAVADLLIVDAASRVAHRAGEAIGMHRLRDGSFACGIGVAFGHADADVLRCFTEVAQSFGAGGMRPAPDRTLMIVGLAQDTLAEFAGDAERLGFIVHADDLRRRVIACAGAPVCASGHLAARDLAPVIASSLASLGERASTIHISGCAKGCAHPAPAALTIVGTAAGCALVENGSTRDAPFATVPLYRLPDAVASVVREGRHV